MSRKVIEFTTQFNDIESEEDLLGLGFPFDKKHFSFKTRQKKQELSDSISEDSLYRLAFSIESAKISY